MIDQIFHVATEFRFDINEAVLSSQTLTNQVNKISDAADNALLSFQHLGAGLVGQLGLGTGGILAVLGKAVQISDHFNATALSFSNIISSNMKVFSGTIGTFNDRLETSKMIMGEINQVANKFALPSASLLRMVELTTPLLAQHGMTGKNFSNAIEISKNVLKSAPNLGINPNESEGQLLRMIGGQTGMHDTLFRRLMTDTTAFRDNHIRNSGQFNAMRPEKRIDLVRKALAVFASDADVLKNRVDSLHGQMTILENNFMEFGSVLKPIGDAIVKPLVLVLKELNRFVDTDARQLSKSLGKAITNIFEDPKNLLINLMQMRQLGKDTKQAGHLFGLIEMFLVLKHLSQFKMGGALANVAKSAVTFIQATAVELVKMIPVWGIFSFLIRAVWFGVSRLLPGMAAMVMLMQSISRAKAIAHVHDVQAMIGLAPKLTDMFVRFKVALENIFYPITVAMDQLARMIAPLFEISNYGEIALVVLNPLADAMEALGRGSLMLMAGIQGLEYEFLQFIENVKHPMKHLTDSTSLDKAFNMGTEDWVRENYKRFMEKGAFTANTVNNIGKVEIRNDFKENQDPDRIAFTLKEQLMKSVRNATQGRGTSFQGAFTR